MLRISLILVMLLSARARAGTLVEALHRRMSDKTSWYLDGASGAIVFSGYISIDPQGFDQEEMRKLYKLYRDSIIEIDGGIYDLRQTTQFAILQRQNAEDLMTEFIAQREACDKAIR